MDFGLGGDALEGSHAEEEEGAPPLKAERCMSVESSIVMSAMRYRRTQLHRGGSDDGVARKALERKIL